jgi:hypothetical protein
MPEREPAIGQVVLARVTQVKPYGITVRVEPYGIDGFVDISDFNGDVDAIRACEDYLVPGDGGRYKNVKVQYIGKTRDVHKFSIAGATISTGDGHGDMFNPVGRKDGTIVLVGFTKKSTNRLKVLKWLAEEGRKYHPRAIPRDAALDAVTIGLMEEFGGEPQRKVVGVVLHAIIDRPNEPWVTLDNERNIIITEGGWSLAAINGIVPPWMSPHGKPTELAVEEPQEPQEELQELVVENRPVEKVAAKLDIAEYIRKTARLAVILAEKAEIEAWLRENHDEILGLVSTPPQSQK